MRIISAPELEPAEAAYADRAILCLELDPVVHLLLWSCRELLHARQEGRAVRQVLGGLKGAPDRSSTILLRLLVCELTAAARRNLHFGLPHCQHVLPDELMLLAAIDRIQMGDEARAGLLLQGLCSNADVCGLLEAADHLGKVLHSGGITVQVMRFVPSSIIPSIH